MSSVEKEAIVPKVARHGLSLLGAAMFIVGEIAGTGVLALPDAVKGSGWSGIVLIVFCCMVAAFSGIYLGHSWLIIEERWPECRGKVRTPFATIAEKAVGPKMRTFAMATMNFQLFGGTVVLLLLCAEMVRNLTATFIGGVTFCDWILVLGLVLLPMTFFGSPADFWPVAVIAMGATAISSVLVTVAVSTDAAAKTPVFTPPAVNSFFLSIGTMMFSVSGACALPTFQNDMKDKRRFPLACTLGFATMCAMYLAVSASSYAIYGQAVDANIISNLPVNGLSIAINVFMTSHVFCAFLIVINPINLSMEDYLNIPHDGRWQRSGFRTFMVMSSVFVAASVPRFGKILNLIGASTASLQTFIMPPLFYILLCRQTTRSDAKITGAPVHRVSAFTWTVATVMTVTGVVAGVAATYYAVFDIYDPATFTPPCYIDECAANNRSLS